METKQELLDRLYAANSEEPFYVCKMIGDKASKWLLYPIETNATINDNTFEGCNQRQILKHEVIFDIDVPKTQNRRNREDILEEAKKQAHKITERLRLDGLGFDVFWSGNKGLHIQQSYPELKDYSDGERLFLKREIIKKYAYDCDVDLQKCSAKTMIQMENTPHRKTLKNKEHWGMFGHEGKIPQDILLKLHIRRAGTQMKKELKSLVKEEVKEILSLPPCIVYIRDNKIPEGNRDNALFSLISHLKHEYNYEELTSFVGEWTAKNCNLLSYYQIKQKIDSANKTPFKTKCQYNKNLMEDIGQKDICNGCDRK